MLINRVCPVCGKGYEADATRLKFGRQVTCSRACSYAFRAAKLRSGASVRCATCGKEMVRTPAQLRTQHGAVYCSRPCHYAGRSLGLTKRVVTKPYTVTPEGKAAQLAASARPKGQRVFHYLVCRHCGKTFDDPSDGRERRSGLAFCSLDCCNAYRKGANNPAWRGGYPGYYGPDWRGLRRAARKRDAYTCRRCGVVQAPPLRAPDVHHIKPVGAFADPNDANTIDNVVCLCHRCHMAVEWHGIDFPV